MKIRELECRETHHSRDNIRHYIIANSDLGLYYHIYIEIDDKSVVGCRVSFRHSCDYSVNIIEEVPLKTYTCDVILRLLKEKVHQHYSNLIKSTIIHTSERSKYSI